MNSSSQPMNTVCPSGSLRYIWRSGDTVAAVATAFGTTVSAMIDVNPTVDFSSVRAGAVICVPSRALTCPDSDLYAIQKGDTLYAIAQKFGISTAALMELNPYVEPTRLAIGQYICVPRQPAQDPCPSGQCCEKPEPAPDCASILNAQRACSQTDTVKCGETLYDILAKYGMSFAEFSALNPRMAFQALLPGQNYLRPLRACACAPSGKYTIRAGDTVSSIATGVGISASELMRRNPNLTPAEFTVGAEICVSYPAQS